MLHLAHLSLARSPSPCAFAMALSSTLAAAEPVAGLSSFLSTRSHSGQPARLDQQLRRDRRQARQQHVWEGVSDDEEGSALDEQQRGTAHSGGVSDVSSDEEGGVEQQRGAPQQQSGGRQAGGDEDEDDEEDDHVDEQDRYGAAELLTGGERARGSTRDWERIAMERLKQQHSIDADSDRTHSRDHQQNPATLPGGDGHEQNRVLGKRRRNGVGEAAREASGTLGDSGRDRTEISAAATMPSAASHARALVELFEKQDGEQFESFDDSDTTQRPMAGAVGRGQEDGSNSDPWLQQIDDGDELRNEQPTADSLAQAVRGAVPLSAVPQANRAARHTAFTLQPFNADTAKSHNTTQGSKCIDSQRAALRAVSRSSSRPANLSTPCRLLIVQRLSADDETPQAALRRLAASGAQTQYTGGLTGGRKHKRNQRTKPSRLNQPLEPHETQQRLPRHSQPQEQQPAGQPMAQSTHGSDESTSLKEGQRHSSCSSPLPLRVSGLPEMHLHTLSIDLTEPRCVCAALGRVACVLCGLCRVVLWPLWTAPAIADTFSFLTDLCAQCVREGLYDIYGLTRRQLAASAASQQTGQPAALQHSAAGTVAAMTNDEDEQAEYVVKASEHSSVVLGPFTTNQLQQQQQTVSDSATAVYRRVGHSRWLPLSQF